MRVKDLIQELSWRDPEALVVVLGLDADGMGESPLFEVNDAFCSDYSKEDLVMHWGNEQPANTVPCVTLRPHT